MSLSRLSSRVLKSMSSSLQSQTMSLTEFGIVTGAGKSIGREAGFKFAESGAKGVIFAGRTESDIQDAAEESKKYATDANYRPIPFQVDISNEAEVNALFARAVKEFGRVDFVINSAGVSGASAFIPESSAEVFDRVLNVNAKGTYLVTAEATRVMSKQDEVFATGRGGKRSVGRGAIVHVASLAGVQAIPSGVSYVASKFATVGITLATTCELARSGIRSNVVCPSWTESRMMDQICERKPGWREKVESMSPAGRMAKAEEVAEVCHFLCTNGASFINGEAIRVDAGFSQSRGYS